MKGDPVVELELVERFEAARPRLLSLAHRILGSLHDAEDAVQTAWLRAAAGAAREIDNPEGWLTTVTARLCLDQLRARQRRGELPLLADALPGERLAADEDFLRREEVSRALLVLLGRLTPHQRVAFVLHDLFAVPFDQVAAVLDTTQAAAKKLASRARIRLRETGPPRAADAAEQREIVEAFLAAARGGDIDRLVALMAPGVVRTVDAALLSHGVPARVSGAAAVAKETRSFAGRVAASVPMLVDGLAGAVIAPGGHPWGIVRFQIRAGAIAAIAIAPYEPAAGVSAWT